MKKQVMVILLLLVILLIDVSIAPEIEEDYLPNELIIKYKDNIVIEDSEAVKELSLITGLDKPEQVEKLIKSKEIYNLKFNENINIQDAIKTYEELEDIEYAEPNYIFTTTITPDDTLYTDLWGLPNINAEQTWNITTGSPSVIIAIIDTGIDWNHPDLASNIWNNTDEDCTDGTDEDGNGYIDDCRGYDFVNVTSGCTDNDCTLEDNNPTDAFGHGTHVAGTVGAISNNGVGVTGICWNCSLMAVRAGYKDSSNQGSLAVSDVVQALNYATINNATIISMSFGGSDSATVQAAINDSYNNGTILVASAGNDGTNTKKYPCAYTNVICVAATDSDNTSASYSNYGNWINLSAPGTGIWSTYYNDTYASQQGTSMSTPLVAGAIGLIKTLFPNKTQIQIENTLNNTGTSVDFNGFNLSRINIYSAILSYDNILPIVNLTSPLDNSVNLTQNQTFVCNVIDWQLDNITFQIWNSTNLYYNETRDVSGMISSQEFNLTDIPYNNYKWNCLAYDEKNNFANAGSNFTLIIGNITVALISPINDTNVNIDFNEFNCSAQTESTKSLTNITFSLWNSTDLIYNLSRNISGTLNSSLFNYTFSTEAEYKWYCQAFNNVSLSAISNNNTIIYDATLPVINLSDPSDSTSYASNSQTINFGFNVSDDNNIANCSLILGEIINQTNTTITKGIINFSATFPPAVYNWNVNCTDNANNMGNSSMRSFTITAPPITTALGGGGGGSSSTAKTYIISNKQISDGYTKELSKNDKVKFTFFDKEAEQHILTVNEIGKDFVEITIQSDPISLKLGIGQSAKVNLTSPQYYDLYVRLNSIENNKADLTIQIINEEIPRVSEPTITSEGVLEDLGESADEIELLTAELDKLKNIVYIIVALILLAIIYLLFKEKKLLKHSRIRKKVLKKYRKTFKDNVRVKKR